MKKIGLLPKIPIAIALGISSACSCPRRSRGCS